MTDLLSDEHRAWIGHEEAVVQIEVSRRDIIKYSIATEQCREKYLKGDEAPLMFVFNLFKVPQQLTDLRPDGLPKNLNEGIDLPLDRVMAGGTEITQHRPIRPGDQLTGTTTIKDLYEKDGRQGPLIFTVRELNVVDSEGEPVFTEIQTSIAN